MEDIEYLSTCSQLPADAPVGHPHLIDIESVDADYPSYPQPGLCIADMVVTILYNYNPETLERFLDRSHDFKFHIHFKREGGLLDFVIIRKGNTVTCGYLTESAMRKIQLWDSEHIYCLYDGPTGKWTPVIWRAWLGLEETDEEEVLDMGSIAAKACLPGQPWVEFDVVEMLVEDSCDL